MTTTDRTSAGPSVRPSEPTDRDALVRLLLTIPPGEHLFVKRSVTDAAAAGAWLDDTPARWVVATVGGAIIGAAAVVPGSGWSAHVGEIRMVVDPRHRRIGVGAALARAALRCAVEHGALVVTVEALAEQQGIINLFRGLGFVPEALLTDHVRDADGQLHDLVVLVHSVRDIAATSATLGVGTGLDAP